WGLLGQGWNRCGVHRNRASYPKSPPSPRFKRVAADTPSKGVRQAQLARRLRAGLRAGFRLHAWVVRGFLRGLVRLALHRGQPGLQGSDPVVGLRVGLVEERGDLLVELGARGLEFLAAVVGDLLGDLARLLGADLALLDEVVERLL